MVIILCSPQSGHAEVAEVLLSSSPAADASCRDGKGSTALHLAAINGRAEVAEAILGRIEGAPKKLLLEAPDRQGRTAAHMAAQEDHGGVLRALIEAGAEAGAKDERGIVFLLISLLLNVKKLLHFSVSYFPFAHVIRFHSPPLRRDDGRLRRCRRPPLLPLLPSPPANRGRRRRHPAPLRRRLRLRRGGPQDPGLFPRVRQGCAGPGPGEGKRRSRPSARGGRVGQRGGAGTDAAPCGGERAEVKYNFLSPARLVIVRCFFDATGAALV